MADSFHAITCIHQGPDALVARTNGAGLQRMLFVDALDSVRLVSVQGQRGWSLAQGSRMPMQ